MESLNERKYEREFVEKLAKEAVKIIVLNVPNGTQFGIDLKIWKTANNFKGIRMIPPGFHYVHYSAANEFGELAPKIGFFQTFHTSEIIVKQWDKKEEDISAEAVPEETIKRLKDNMQEVDKYLAWYPFDVWIEWVDLTNRIKPSVVERCLPICGFVRSALELEYCSDAMRPRGGVSNVKRKKRSGITAEEKEDELLPDLKAKPGTELRFSKLPDKNYPDDASPSEITKHSLDSSYALETFLTKLPQSIEFIGEMQLAFVCFLVGQSLEAFEHWKKLVILICSADSAMQNQQAIYLEFIRALETQMMHVPIDVLCDIVANNNFVYQSLRKLFANIEDNSCLDNELKFTALRFRNRLTEKFSWDFSDIHEIDEDEEPVIVSSD